MWDKKEILFGALGVFLIWMMGLSSTWLHTGKSMNSVSTGVTYVDAIQSQFVASGSASPKVLVVDMDPYPGGGVVMTGYIVGSFSIGQTNVSSNGTQPDMFTAKFSDQKELDWFVIRENGAFPDFGQGVEVLPNGSVVMVGVFGNQTQSGPAQVAYFEIFDQNGNGQVAATSSLMSAYDSFDDVDNFSNSGFVACGKQQSLSFTIRGLSSNKQTSTQSMIVYAFDAQGNPTWNQRTEGSGTTAICDDIYVDSSDDVYVVGSYGGTTLFDPDGAQPIQIGSTADVYLAKYDGDTGAIEFVVPLTDVGTQGSARILNIDQFSNGDLALVGRLNGSQAGGGDLYISRYTSTGTLVWSEVVSQQPGTGPAIDFAYDAEVFDDDTFLVSGFFGGSMLFGSGNESQILTASGTSDGFVALYDGDGMFQWAQMQSSTGNNITRAVSIIDQDSFWVAGEFMSGLDLDPMNGQLDLDLTTSSSEGNLFLGEYSLQFAQSATQLAIEQQPVDGFVNALPQQSLQVSVNDAQGQRVTSFTDTVTLSFAVPASGVNLKGEVSVNAVNGLAIFDEWYLSDLGQGYVLQVETGSIAAVQTDAFSVSELSSQLQFVEHLKANQSGSLLRLEDVLADNTGGFLASGNFFVNGIWGNTDPGRIAQQSVDLSPGGGDGFVARYSPNHEIDWLDTINQNGLVQYPDEGRAMARLSDGHTVVVGLGGRPGTSSGLIITKLNKDSGSPIYTKIYPEGGAVDDTFTDVVATNDGFIAVAQNLALSTTIDGVTVSNRGSIEGQIILARFLNDGSVVWVKHVETPTTAPPQGGFTRLSLFPRLTLAPDGSFYVVGNYPSGSIFGLNEAQESTLAGSGVGFLAHYNADGTLRFSQSLDDYTQKAEYFGPQAVGVLSDGEVVVAGNQSSSGFSRMFVQRFSSAGVLLQEKLLPASGASHQSAARDLVVRSDDSFLLTGTFYPQMSFPHADGSFDLSSVSAAPDIFIGQFGKQFDALWVQEAGGTASDDVSSVTLSTDENTAYIGGYMPFSNLIFSPGLPEEASVTTTNGSLEGYVATYSVTTTTASNTQTHLAFVQQPTDVGVNAVISPAVTVEILNAQNQRVMSNAEIMIAMKDAQPGAMLGGSLFVNAVDGLATFPDLSIDTVGSLYSLRATAFLIQSADSTSFQVLSSVSQQLTVTQDPLVALAEKPIDPPIVVEIRNDQNQLVTTANNEVTLSYRLNPHGATTGPFTTTAVNGVATFNDVVIDKVGDGYQFEATASGLSSANTRVFNVYVTDFLSVVKSDSSPTNGANLVPSQVLHSSDDGFSIVGKMTGVTDIGAFRLESTGQQTGYVVRYSPDGSVQYANTFYASNSLPRVVELGNGNLVVTGGYILGSGKSALRLIEVNPSQQTALLVDQITPSLGIDVGDMIVFPDGSLLITGRLEGNMGNGGFSLTAIGSANTTLPAGNAYVMKYTSGFIPNGALNVGGPNAVSDGLRLIPLQDGGYYLLGRYVGTLSLGSDSYTSPDLNSYHGFLARFNAQDQVLWSQNFPVFNSQVDMTLLSDESVVVFNREDTYMAKLRRYHLSDGQELWTRDIGDFASGGSIFVHAVTALSDDSVVGLARSNHQVSFSSPSIKTESGLGPVIFRYDKDGIFAWSKRELGFEAVDLDAFDNDDIAYTGRLTHNQQTAFDFNQTGQEIHLADFSQEIEYFVAKYQLSLQNGEPGLLPAPTNFVMNGSVGGINAATVLNSSFSVDSAVDATLSYTFLGPVSQQPRPALSSNPSVSAGTNTFSNFNFTGFDDGQIQVSLDLEDGNGANSPQVMVNVQKDTVALAPTNIVINGGNDIEFDDAQSLTTSYDVLEVGDVRASYRVLDQGSVQGTVERFHTNQSSGTVQDNGVNLSLFTGDTIKLVLTFTDVFGNEVQEMTQVSYTPLQVTSLRFVQQPTEVIRGDFISPDVSVELLDQNGSRLDTNANVSLAITPSTGVAFGGSHMVAAVNGLAIFPGLSVNPAGTYTLIASSDGVTDVNSQAFGVREPPQMPSNLNVNNGTNRVTGANAGSTRFTVNMNIAGFMRYSVTDENSTVVSSRVACSQGPVTLENLNVSTLADGDLIFTIVLEGPLNTESAPLVVTILKDTVAEGPTDLVFNEGNVYNFASFSSQNIPYTFDIQETGSFLARITDTDSNVDDTDSVTQPGSQSFDFPNIGNVVNFVNGQPVTELQDGPLTFSIAFTDSFGNIANTVVDVIQKDTVVYQAFDVKVNGEAANVLNGKHVNASNVNQSSITFEGVDELGSVDYFVRDNNTHEVSGNHPVTQFGTQTISGLDLSSLDEGLFLVQLVARDQNGNSKNTSTGFMYLKDTEVDPIRNLTFGPVPGGNINNVTQSNIKIEFDADEVGKVEYEFLDENGGRLVGEIDVLQTGFQSNDSFDLSPLDDGLITLNAVFIDGVGNRSSIVTDSAPMDRVAEPLTDIRVNGDAVINASRVSNFSITYTAAELGDTRIVIEELNNLQNTVTIDDPVTNLPPQVITGDVSTLQDDNLIFRFTFTDTFGNEFVAAPITIRKDETIDDLTNIVVNGGSVVNNDQKSLVPLVFDAPEAGVSKLFYDDGTTELMQGVVVGPSAPNVALDPFLSQTAQINFSTLQDGTITTRFEFEDHAGNISQGPGPDVLMDTQVEMATSIVINGGDPINNSQQSVVEVAFDVLEPGASQVIISDDVNQIQSQIQSGNDLSRIQVLDVSSLDDGFLNVMVNFTDDAGNDALTAAASVQKITQVNGINGSIVLNEGNVINKAGETTVSINFDVSVLGTAEYSIRNGAQEISGQYMIPNVAFINPPGQPQPDITLIENIDVSSLPDGELTAEVVFTDEVGNVANLGTDQVVKDTIVNLPQDILLNGGQNIPYGTRGSVVLGFSLDEPGSFTYRFVQSANEVESGVSFPTAGEKQIENISLIPFGASPFTLEVSFADEAGNMAQTTLQLSALRLSGGLDPRFRDNQVVSNQPVTVSPSGGGGTIENIKLEMKNDEEDDEGLKKIETIDEDQNEGGFFDFLLGNEDKEDNPSSLKLRSDSELKEDNEIERFEDVKEGDDGFREIHRLKELGVVQGINNSNVFAPSRFIDRAQILKILMKLMAYEEPQTVTRRPFVDIPTREWYSPFVWMGKQLGFIDGYPDGSFKPAQLVNKAEAMKMMYRVLGIQPEEVTQSIFADIPDNEWHLPYFANAYQKGILEVDEFGSVRYVDPAEIVDRVWFAKMVIRLWESNEELTSRDLDVDQVVFEQS